MFCERLYTQLVSYILVGCTAQFCFSSVFLVMMVVKWSAGREFFCYLQGVKTFKANLSGMQKTYDFLPGGGEEGRKVLMPVLVVNSVRPTVLDTEISLQRRQTAAHSSAQCSAFSFLALSCYFEDNSLSHCKFLDLQPAGYASQHEILLILLV